jgi:PAS domain S-box-containing protein
VRRALLITDKTEVVTEVRQVLEGREYRVIPVPHGDEALTQAEELLPEVILLHMTATDSRETPILQRLARRGITKQVGVLLLLDAFEEETVARALDGGAADYIGRPFDPERLVRRVGVLARIRQEARERWDALSGQEELPDHVPYGCFLSTREGRLVKVNLPLATMLGYESKEELVGIDLEREVYWNSRDSQLFQDILERQGVVENFPVQLRRKDGQKITVFIDGRSIRDAAGGWVGYAAMRVEQREPYRLTEQEREGTVVETSPKTEPPKGRTGEAGGQGLLRARTTDRGGILRRLLARMFPRRGESASRVKAPELIGGRFAKVERLGMGSYGEIWKVREVGGGADGAIYVAKIPRSKRLNHQIQREAAICERLRGHPGAVAVVEVVEDRGRLVLVQEFVEGPTLRELLERPLWDAERASIALQVIDIVAQAHRHRIVHRDIKPENIIVRPDGVVKLLDYGAAKELKDQDVSSTMVGSRPFMAPEQIMGESQIASDVWALGVIMYALYTEHLPFYHDNEKVLMDMILTLEPEPPRSLEPRLPVALEEIILRCLQKDPRARYPDADAVKEAVLERFPEYGHRG